MTPPSNASASVRIGMYKVDRDFIAKLGPVTSKGYKKSNYCDLARSMEIGELLFIHKKYWYGKLGYKAETSSPQTTLNNRYIKGKWSRRLFSEGWIIERIK